MDTRKISIQKLIEVLLVIYMTILILTYFYHAKELRKFFSETQKNWVKTQIERVGL